MVILWFHLILLGILPANANFCTDGIESVIKKYLGMGTDVAKGVSFDELNRKIANHHRVLFFKKGQLLKVGEAELTSGKSYVVVVDNGKLIIGENYLNASGTTSETHIMLMEDIKSPDPKSYRKSAGAIRIKEDGSIDVSGYHMKHESKTAAKAIAKKLREIIPNVKLRTTPGRLSDLP